MKLMLGVLACAAVTMGTVRLLGWPYWSYHLLAVVVGTACCVACALLMHYYIRRNAPEFANNDEMIPGIKNWELTAGLGIVPRWVSLLGLTGFAFVLASPFELIASLFR